MTSLHPLRSFVAAATVTVLLFTAARAEDDTTSIKFSDPAQPGTLKISVTNGDIHVRGEDKQDITVKSSAQPEASNQREDGLRVLTSSASYSLTEKGNVVTLTHGSGVWPGSEGNFEVTVPRNTTVIISNALGGDLKIEEITGNIEVKSLNGEVELRGVSGGALVETMNGEITVEVHSLAEAKPLSFTSMNGEVQVRLPADAKANVHLRTHNGSILTDFNEQQLVTKTTSVKKEGRMISHGVNGDEIRATVQAAVRVGVEAAREAGRAAREAVREARRANGEEVEIEDEIPHDIPMPPVPPLPPMTGGKIVTGTLNGGGPEIRITTMNGDVTLRKAE